MKKFNIFEDEILIVKSVTRVVCINNQDDGVNENGD